MQIMNTYYGDGSSLGAPSVALVKNSVETPRVTTAFTNKTRNKSPSAISMQKARQIFRHSFERYEKSMNSEYQPFNKHRTRILHAQLKKHVHDSMEKEVQQREQAEIQAAEKRNTWKQMQLMYHLSEDKKNKEKQSALNTASIESVLNPNQEANIKMWRPFLWEKDDAYKLLSVKQIN